MIKWWTGCSVSESTETLVRYLLDQTLQVEESELTDCLAPDRARAIGCPSEPHKALGSEHQEDPTIKRMETSLEDLSKDVKSILEMLRSSPPQEASQATIADSTISTSPAATNLIATTPSAMEIPTAKQWQDVCKMWWFADSSRHLYKPISN